MPRRPLALQGAGVARPGTLLLVDIPDIVSNVNRIDASITIPVAVFQRAIDELRAGILLLIYIAYQNCHVQRIDRVIKVQITKIRAIAITDVV